MHHSQLLAPAVNTPAISQLKRSLGGLNKNKGLILHLISLQNHVLTPLRLKLHLK